MRVLSPNPRSRLAIARATALARRRLRILSREAITAGEHPDYAKALAGSPPPLAALYGQGNRCSAAAGRLRSAARRAARLSGRGQRLGLLVRALPASSSRSSSAPPPATASGSPSSASTAKTPTTRRAPSSARSPFPTPATPTPTRRSRRARRHSACRTPPSTTGDGELVHLKQGPYSDARSCERRHRALRARPRAEKADNQDMDIFVVIAVVAILVLLAELLLPTGGVLAAIGALGLIAAGVVALTADADSSASDWAGPALITLGLLSIVSSYVSRAKCSPRTARSRSGPAARSWSARGRGRARRSTPTGQVWVEGALWRARLAAGGAPLRPGDRVTSRGGRRTDPGGPARAAAETPRPRKEQADGSQHSSCSSSW